MARQVIHDDRVGRLDGPCEDVGHVGAGGLLVHRTIEQPGRADAGCAQACRDGRGLPILNWRPKGAQDWSGPLEVDGLDKAD